MTEIPEHLLRRSRERREALGLAKPGEGGAAPAEASAAPATGTEVEPAAAAATPAPAPAPAPAPVAPPPPKPDPPHVAAAKNRRKIPWWAMPAVAGLPIWAGVYAWTLEPPSVGETDPLALGQELYEGKGTCAGCHGVNGEGISGPPFQNGAVGETWENWRNHVAWVTLGGDNWPSGTYGNAEKTVGGVGRMPGFEGQLTPEEIALIVRYEREVLAGLDPEEEPDLVAITDAIGLGESTTEDGENVEEVLTEAQEPGDGPGGTSEPPPE